MNKLENLSNFRAMKITTVIKITRLSTLTVSSI
jgi:hypothetical protein